MKTKETGKTRPIRTNELDEKRIAALQKKTSYDFTTLVKMGLEMLAEKYGI